ncbi:MAG: amino-acid N-acetyltransferase [Verrucomicrobiales bacterium]|jgi:amino-acid N-acetyltransferase|nr:amino-acid N-acetyltransferase [Verrucomicrobiales bacterium]
MKLTDLRGILQYIPRFREKVFVIAIDGAIVTDENFSNILLDIAVLRSLNIRVVIVHGASAQIKAMADAQTMKASDLDGSGITDADTLKLALTAANRLTHEILEGLSANDLRAASTNAIVAHPMGILHGLDHLFTGKVERVDTELFQTLLGQGIIPVVPPLGFDGDGHTYRVNSDHMAVEIAEALKATKLIFITTTDGLFSQGQLIRQILASDLDAILAGKKQEVIPEMLSKAIYASAACRAGVPRVHLINGRVDEGLLAEVFSNEGIGTLIYANEYQQIRRAMKKDIRAIMMLTKNAVASDELVKRTRAGIEKHLQDYYIFEIDKNPVACVALHLYSEQSKGELACLYVSPSHENQGIGRKLIQFVESKARELGLHELLLLSTQAFTYFQSKAGFVEGSPDDLPQARREKYDQSGRKSKVLVKKLNGKSVEAPPLFLKV